MLSRVFGLFRDVTLAALFGTSIALANFLVAFRLSNLFRRVFAESPLSSSFIPTFEKKRSVSEEKGALFFRDLFFLFLILGLLVTGAFQGATYLMVNYFQSESAIEIATLVVIMLPSLALLILYGLTTALLQTYGKYFSGAVAPVLANLTWILAACAARAISPESPMKILSFGIVLGFAVQLSLTLFYAGKILKSIVPIKHWMRHWQLKKSLQTICKPYLLTMVGISGTQLNTFFDSLFAKMADPSGPAYLWYAIRLEQVPLSFFAISLSVALLPSLTRAMKSHDLELFDDLLEKTIKKTAILLSLSSVLLGLVSIYAVEVIYFRGAFDSVSLAKTSLCLWGYLLGLTFQGLVIVLIQSFYASYDYKRPMRATLLAVGLNIVLNALFVFYLKFGAFSIALATSISSLFHFLYLFHNISKELQSKLRKFSKKLLLCSSCSVVVGLMMAYLIGGSIFNLAMTGSCASTGLLRSISSGAILVAGSTLTFLLSLKVAKMKDLKILFERRG